MQEHAYGEGLRRPSSTSRETNSASNSRRSSMLSRLGSHQVSLTLCMHHLSGACNSLLHCPGTVAPKGLMSILQTRQSAPRGMHGDASSRSSPHAGQHEAHEHSMVTGAFAHASKAAFCMLMLAAPQEQALESIHSLGHNYSWVPVMHADAQPGTLPAIWHHQSAQSARDAVSSCRSRHLLWSPHMMCSLMIIMSCLFLCADSFRRLATGAMPDIDISSLCLLL